MRAIAQLLPRWRARLPCITCVIMTMATCAAMRLGSLLLGSAHSPCSVLTVPEAAVAARPLESKSATLALLGTGAAHLCCRF